MPLKLLITERSDLVIILPLPPCVIPLKSVTKDELVIAKVAVVALPDILPIIDSLNVLTPLISWLLDRIKTLSDKSLVFTLNVVSFKFIPLSL